MPADAGITDHIVTAGPRDHVVDQAAGPAGRATGAVIEHAGAGGIADPLGDHIQPAPKCFDGLVGAGLYTRFSSKTQ